MPHPLRRRSKVHRLAIEVNSARIRPDYPSDNLDQGTFTGAVLADDGVDRAERAFEIDVRERCDATVMFSDSFEPQERMPGRLRHQWYSVRKLYAKGGLEFSPGWSAAEPWVSAK